MAGQGMARRGTATQGRVFRNIIQLKNMAKQLAISKITLDFTVLPREIDDSHVGRIAEAIRAGVEMPPVIVEKLTNRLVGGLHRVKAYMKIYGADAAATEIAVEFREYATEADLYADAVRDNGTHGKNYSPFDLMRIAMRAEELGLPLERIAESVGCRREKIEGLLAKRTASKSSGVRIALKQTIRHKVGSELTEKQAEVNEHLSGMNQSFYVNQLIALIEADLIDMGNEYLMERLFYLRELVDKIPVLEVAA